jgi:hypothetical protein
MVDEAEVTRSLLLRRIVFVGSGGRSLGPQLNGDLLRVGGNLDISFLRCTGNIRLEGATIGGRLSGTGAKIEPETGTALNMDWAQVKGSVRLNKGFTSTGKLSMDRAKVGGSVFLDEGFTATGTVRLLGAVIDGQLACGGARIEPTEGEALSMDRATVGGNIILDRDVRLERDFQVTGTVCLIGATSGAELRLELPVGNRSEQPAALLKGCAIDGAVADPDSGQIAEEAISTPVVFDLRNAHLNRLILSRVGGGATSEVLEGTNYVLLDGTTYSGLSSPVKSISLNRPAWSSRLWWSFVGTKELHSDPACFYLSILESAERLPDDGEVYPAVYDTMARVLRNAGQEQLGQALLLAKHRRLRAARPWRARPSRWLLDVTVGYGYRPRLAAVWSITVYLASVLLLWGAVHHNGIVASSFATTPTPATSLPSPLLSQAAYPSFSAWNYAFGALVFPFLHLPDTDAWRANAVNGWGVVVRLVRWGEPVAFWALALTLGAMFTRLLTRDRD